MGLYCTEARNVLQLLLMLKTVAKVIIILEGTI